MVGTWIGDRLGRLCAIGSNFARHVVAQLVVALGFKPEGRGFDFRWRRNFSSAPNRNELRQPVRGAYLHVPIVWKSVILDHMGPSGSVQRFLLS